MFDAAIASAQPALCVPPHLPAAPPRQAHRRRSGQGVGGHGAGGGAELVRAAVGAGGHALRLRRAVRAHRDRRSGASGAGCRGHACGAAHARAGRGLERGRSGAVPFFRRRLGAVAAAGIRTRSRSQAGGEPRTAGVRRHHQRDELRAPPSLRHQRRPPGRGLSPGARAHLAHLRCARRPADRYRVGSHGGGSDHLRRCARHPAPLRHRPSGAGARGAGERAR